MKFRPPHIPFSYAPFSERYVVPVTPGKKRSRADAVVFVNNKDVLAIIAWSKEIHASSACVEQAMDISSYIRPLPSKLLILRSTTAEMDTKRLKPIKIGHCTQSSPGNYIENSWIFFPVRTSQNIWADIVRIIPYMTKLMGFIQKMTNLQPWMIFETLAGSKVELYTKTFSGKPLRWPTRVRCHRDSWNTS